MLLQNGGCETAECSSIQSGIDGGQLQLLLYETPAYLVVSYRSADHIHLQVMLFP